MKIACLKPEAYKDAADAKRRIMSKPTSIIKTFGWIATFSL